MDYFRIAQEYKRLKLYNQHDEKILEAYDSLAIWFTYNKQIPENVTVEEFTSLNESAREILLQSLSLPEDLKLHLIKSNNMYKTLI